MASKTKKMPLFQTSAVVVVMACLSVTATGCSPGQSADSSPYQTEITQALQVSESSFEKKVLEDGVITDQEAAEGRALYQQCLSDRGVEVSFTADQYGHMVMTAAGDVPLKIDSDCQRSTVGQSLMLYESMRRNPDNQNEYDLQAACFVRHGLVPKDFTGKDLEALTAVLPSGTASSDCDVEAGDFEQCAKDANAQLNQQLQGVEVPVVTLPGGRPYNGDDPEVSHCLVDPQW